MPAHDFLEVSKRVTYRVNVTDRYQVIRVSVYLLTYLPNSARFYETTYSEYLRW